MNGNKNVIPAAVEQAAHRLATEARRAGMKNIRMETAAGALYRIDYIVSTRWRNFIIDNGDWCEVGRVDEWE